MKKYEVYLPTGCKWYDYWTNDVYEGGQNVKVNAPLAYMPLFVKAGSIVPVGPEVQYVAEKAYMLNPTTKVLRLLIATL